MLINCKKYFGGKMPVAAIDIDELRKIIREEVRSAIQEEFNPMLMEHVLRTVPVASKAEQKEIEELYGEPAEDEVAMTLVLERK
jgi:hypothetical protein